MSLGVGWRSRSTLAILAVAATGWAATPLYASEDDLPAPIADYPAFYCYLEDADGELSGYVEMSFTVMTDGDVRNPVVIRSEACIKEVIPQLETLAIEKLLDRYRYRPRIVDGEAVEVSDVRTRIFFLYDPTPRDGGGEGHGMDRWEFLEYVKQYAEDNPSQPPRTKTLQFQMFAD